MHPCPLFFLCQVSGRELGHQVKLKSQSSVCSLKLSLQEQVLTYWFSLVKVGLGRVVFFILRCNMITALLCGVMVNLYCHLDWI